MVKAIKELGLETCMTLGQLSQEQAQQLAAAGLDFYNHNIDTSPEYYDKIITTRTFQDRLDTLSLVREAGINSCCGGIMGLGESRHDRLSFLQVLANLPEHPLSVPINHLNAFDGTPLAGAEKLDPIEFVRVIASARILMPKSIIRFACGRREMSDELHALCFFAGANSIFYGEKLLMSKNSEMDRDQALLPRLNMKIASQLCKTSPEV
jgi:biotin synthase